MKSTLVILLIGAIVAVACTAPSRSSLKASLQNDGDKKKALKQMDEDGGDLLLQTLLDRIQKQVALEREVSTEEDEDEDDGDKAASQFIHLHFG